MDSFQNYNRHTEVHIVQRWHLKIVNNVLLNMNSQHVSLLVLLDLSAVFDTVDHNIPLCHLETSFGINSDAFKWFQSYLCCQTQWSSS